MKLRKKRGKYKLRTVSIEEVLAAMERWDIENIYSWGAFNLNGLACKVGDTAFRFDFEVNPAYSLGKYLTEHTKDEVAEKIAREINGRGRLSQRTRKQCIEYLSSFL